MRPGDLAPDHAVLGSADLLVSLVDVGNALAEVEAVGSHFVSDLALMGNILHVPWSWEGFCVTYLAASTSSTPSILIRLVAGVRAWRERL